MANSNLSSTNAFIQQVGESQSSLSLSNFPTGGSIGTAATTVDVYGDIRINQTTNSQILTLPTPTITGEAKLVVVSNIGSTFGSFEMHDVNLVGQSRAMFRWNPTTTAWQFLSKVGGTYKILANFPTNAVPIGTASETVNIYDTYVITQSTPLIAVTIPAPSISFKSQTISFVNGGSTMLRVQGQVIPTNGSAMFQWSGATWIAINDNVNNITSRYSKVAATAFGNSGTSSTIPSATVSDNEVIHIAQTTASITLTLGNPTDLVPVRTILIRNSGSAAFTMHGVTVGVSENWEFYWNGGAWVVVSPPTAPTASVHYWFSQEAASPALNARNGNGNAFSSTVATMNYYTLAPAGQRFFINDAGSTYVSNASSPSPVNAPATSAREFTVATGQTGTYEIYYKFGFQASGANTTNPWVQLVVNGVVVDATSGYQALQGANEGQASGMWVGTLTAGQTFDFRIGAGNLASRVDTYNTKVRIVKY